MKEKTYTLFSPPDDLAQKPVKEWTGHEAKQYFNWMVGVPDQRVADFLQYIGESEDQSSELLLQHTGEKLGKVLNTRSCGSSTQCSGPLQQAIADGVIKTRIIPGAE